MPLLPVSTLVVLLYYTGYVISKHSLQPDPHHVDNTDIHGGIPMGVKNPLCDDGKNGIEIDWSPSSTKEWKCEGPALHPKYTEPTYAEEAEAKKPIHTCLSVKLNYGTAVPMSGPHRPLWPKWGEYQYIPPQRWLHSTEHGAAVFLYNPCAPEDEIKQFKALAFACLYKHIISPNTALDPEQPFVIVTWTHQMNMSHVDKVAAENFVRQYSLQGPERIYMNGQYDIGLIKHAPRRKYYSEMVCDPLHHPKEENRIS